MRGVVRRVRHLHLLLLMMFLLSIGMMIVRRRQLLQWSLVILLLAHWLSFVISSMVFQGQSFGGLHLWLRQPIGLGDWFRLFARLTFQQPSVIVFNHR